MASLLLRSFIFTILFPGSVAGLIPYMILGDKLNINFQSFNIFHYAGAIIFVIGLIVMLYCIIQFAVEGKGTLSPIDPTKRLVVTGLYRISRNPMYLGVMMMLIGEAIFTRSAYLWGYILIVFSVFNLFILFIEEPRLRGDFGEEYNQYCQKVRKWM